jgi:hypothetical protein
MYIGMDVHKGMCQVVHISDDGEILEEYEMEPDLKNLEKFAQNVPNDAKIAIEAWTSSRPIYIFV